MRRNGGLLTTT